MSEHTAIEHAPKGAVRKRRSDLDVPQRLRVRLAPEVPSNVRRYRAGLGPFTHEPREVLAELDAERLLRADRALIVERITGVAP